MEVTPMAKKDEYDWLDQMLKDMRAQTIAEDEYYSKLVITPEESARLAKAYPMEPPDEGYAKIGFERFFDGD